MSLTHIVTIHCDAAECGHWIHGEGVPTATRRREGWLVWQNDNGNYRHLCPRCNAEGRATFEGERPDD
jgi:hypothetical protein